MSKSGRRCAQRLYMPPAVPSLRATTRNPLFYVSAVGIAVAMEMMFSVESVPLGDALSLLRHKTVSV